AIKSNGGVTLAIKADSCDPDAIKSAVAQTAGRFGRIDILVNNAGILNLGAVDEYSLSDFDQLIAVNVRAVFVAIQATIPYMTAGGTYHHHRQRYGRSRGLPRGRMDEQGTLAMVLDSLLTSVEQQETRVALF